MLHTQNIKNIKEVAEQSDYGVKLYYNVRENAVNTDGGINYWYITDFIRKNTKEEIAEMVNRWLSM
jgi:hypothetical protein